MSEPVPTPAPTPESPDRLRAVPTPVLFIIGAITQYYGAALAVGLFVLMPAGTVAWLRTLVAAVVLLAWRRPWRCQWSRQTFLRACVFGVVLVTMNIAFYLGIDHLPLGTAVAIEFLGPISVAAIGGRGWRQRAALVLALAGVALISGLGLTWGPGTGIGLAMIGVAAAAWAGYIVLGRRVAVRAVRGAEAQSSAPAGSRPTPQGIDSLAVGMTFATLITLPVFVWTAGPAIQSWVTAATAIGVGVFSSAIPYALDQVNMRRASAARFALLSALLPATATVVGLVVLGQLPTAAELIGLVAISIAVALTAKQ